MRILANENVPQPVVAELRRRGHDVTWMVEVGAEEDDVVVLARAQSEDRIVLTLDKDFGELALLRRLPASAGIVLVRTTGSTPEADNARAVSALESRAEWRGLFTIIEDDRVRVRQLPAAL